MLSINTNLPSLIAQNSLKNSTLKLNTAIERMTTGFKINSAKDNAANYSIVTNMSTKINAYQVAEDNVAMGLNLLDTANGGLDLISDKLTRLRALQEQALNGTYGEQSLKAINAEANAIVDEIERLYNTTEFNGKNIFTNTVERVHNAAIPEDAKGISEANGNITADNTYTLSSVEDLLSLRDFVNNGGKTSGVTFVMTSDIDMSGVSGFSGIGDGGINNTTHTHIINSFEGTFDGNGYEIKNLKINNVGQNMDGALFLKTSGATIRNLGLTNMSVDVYDNSAAGFIALANNTTMVNCYAKNINLHSNDYYNGSLIGMGTTCNVSNCFTVGNLNVDDYSGGLIGHGGGSNISNSYFIGNITYNGGSNSTTDVGAISGLVTNINNCIYNTTSNLSSIDGTNLDNNSRGLTSAEIKNPQIIANYGFTESNGWYTKDGYLPQLTPFAPDVEFNLQVGIHGDENSIINLKTSFILGSIDELRLIGLNTTSNCLSTIDNIISNVSAKQTEYGAVQNRLESALDEISTQYENLVSSRSTLRDADISEVSSEYIKQQILQQASATLLATANQSPALALQLL